MLKFLISFLAFAALNEMSHCLAPESDTKHTKYFVTNPKALDYKFTGKKDEHRFGVELKENKQFHHTKTAEDGVRLGCYGHELEGKKYSTHYVADAKGYRLVPHHGLITVYPKDGSEARKASFVQSFNEEEIRSANIRYFFPDGCQSPQIEIGALDLKAFFPEKIKPEVRTLPAQKKPIDRMENPQTIIKPKVTVPLDNLPEPAIKETTAKPMKVEAMKAPKKIEEAKNLEVIETVTVTKSSTTQQPVVVQAQEQTEPEKKIEKQNLVEVITVKPKNFEPLTLKPNTNVTPNIIRQNPITPRFVEINKCSDTCCDDNRPQLLMSRPTPGSCCKGVSKIVIPIDMEILTKIGTDEIIDITSESNNVAMLNKLLKLVEKYKL